MKWKVGALASRRVDNPGARRGAVCHWETVDLDRDDTGRLHEFPEVETMAECLSHS